MSDEDMPTGEEFLSRYYSPDLISSDTGRSRRGVLDGWWAGPWLWSPRCRAVKEPPRQQVMGGSMRVGGHHGRCELQPHGLEVDHALDRAPEYPRWSTRASVEPRG
ncbi:MAG: hypothetical protein H7Y15_19765 [Pseudonocardia sp.]|nr:hypothetical protein [Pseudonocardia sp.]